MNGSDAGPIKVLISGGLAAGGVQTHVTMLCKVLSEAGVEVTVAAVSSNWSDDAFDLLREMGVRILLPSLGRAGGGGSLAKIEAVMLWPFRLGKHFDILYCHGHGRMHLWMKRFLRKGGMSIYHELVETPKVGSLMAEVAAAMDMVIASSSDVATDMAKVVASERIKVIPCFSTEQGIPMPEHREPVGYRTLRVAYFGRLVSHKQPDWLVKSWASIAAAAPLAPARLDVYGTDYPDQPMLEKLQDYVEKNGLQEVVTLHGRYDHNDASLLKNTDLVLLPSRVEGVPLVLLEAVQHGVPFVAMSAGGIASLAEENPDVIVTPIDNSAFVEAVKLMAERLRQGSIDNHRLYGWAKERYGLEELSALWCNSLMNQVQKGLKS